MVFNTLNYIRVLHNRTCSSYRLCRV